MGGGSKSAPAPTTQTVTQKSEPPEWVRPYSIDYLKRADPLSKQPYAAYPYSRVSDLTPEHYAGLGQMSGYGLFGAPGEDLAQNTWGQTVRGDYLNANPYVNSMFNDAARGVVDQYRYGTAPQTDTSAARARALGGSAHQQYGDMQRFGLGQNLNSLATQIYGGNYMNERQNQMNALQMLPTYANIPLNRANALLGAGDVMREYNQAQINQDYENWQQSRMWPYSQLDVLGNALGVASGGGGSTVTTSPSFYEPNRAANVIGGGLLGYGLGQNVDKAGLGAGVGALGGYFL